MTEMGITVGVGRTHMYYKGTPEFPFGHGLSYSDWEIQILARPQLLSVGGSNTTTISTIEVAVTNNGPLPGSETILIFWKPSNCNGGHPRIRQKLVGFESTGHLDVGATRYLLFDFEWKDFALYVNGKKDQLLPCDNIIEARISNEKRVSTVLERIMAPPGDDSSAF